MGSFYQHCFWYPSHTPQNPINHPLPSNLRHVTFLARVNRTAAQMAKKKMGNSRNTRRRRERYTYIITVMHKCNFWLWLSINPPPPSYCDEQAFIPSPFKSPLQKFGRNPGCSHRRHGAIEGLKMSYFKKTTAIDSREKLRLPKFRKIAIKSLEFLKDQNDFPLITYFETKQKE